MKKLLIVMLVMSLYEMLFLPFVEAQQSRQSQAKPVTKPLIGPVKDEELVDMCGCTFARHTIPPSYTFLGDSGGQMAWMNIDGEAVKLQLFHSRAAKVCKIGSRYTETFKADGIKVFLVMIVNRLCIPYSPECETTGYNVMITVRKGNRVETVKTKGQCGCL
jgi:hypothetical protein